MKIKSLFCIVCLSLTTFAQTQPTPKTIDNTQVCHLPNATKASMKPAVLMEGYGKVHMSVTTKSAEAQAFFDQGLALMHSFWFYEADRSFERAAQLDPECAMAQWGIAMSDINEERRNSAIKRGKELAPKVSEREQLYLAAVEARYAGEKSTVQNNGFLGASDPYQKAMRKLVSFYNDDLEAKLFLALTSMSGYERDGTPNAGTVEAIALLQAVLAKSPNHLAAHHYMIHATEAGKRPVDGVPAADIYGTLAPKVGHAVHMPGHTYVHVDRWQDAARAFENSAAVDRAYIRDNKETTDHAAGPYGHNVHFLANVYGYQGRYRDGILASQELLDAAKQPGEEKSRAGFEGRLARLRILTRFEKWDEILLGIQLPDEGNYEIFKAWRFYALTLAQLNRPNGMMRGDNGQSDSRTMIDALEREIAWMKDKLAKAKDLPQLGRQKQQLKALGVAPIELKARIAAQENKADEAIKLLREAIEEEIKLGYSEPPLYPLPMQEVAGKICLQLKRYTEAEEFFRAALERDPGSGRAYFGLMQAQQNSGKQSEARETYAKFMKAWKQADEDLPEMKLAKEKAAEYGVASNVK